jgi:hypothetical protein
MYSCCSLTRYAFSYCLNCRKGESQLSPFLRQTRVIHILLSNFIWKPWASSFGDERDNVYASGALALRLLYSLCDRAHFRRTALSLSLSLPMHNLIIKFSNLHREEEMRELQSAFLSIYGKMESWRSRGQKLCMHASHKASSHHVFVGEKHSLSLRNENSIREWVE